MNFQIAFFLAGSLCLSAVVSQELLTFSIIEGHPLGSVTKRDAGGLDIEVLPVSTQEHGGAHTFEGRTHPENHSEEIHNHTHAFENVSVSQTHLKHLNNRSDDSLDDHRDPWGNRSEPKGKHASFLPPQPKRPKRDGFKLRQSADSSNPPLRSVKPESPSVTPPSEKRVKSSNPPPGAQGKARYRPPSGSSPSRRPKPAGFVPVSGTLSVPSNPPPVNPHVSLKSMNLSNLLTKSMPRRPNISTPPPTRSPGEKSPPHFGPPKER